MLVRCTGRDGPASSCRALVEDITFSSAKNHETESVTKRNFKTIEYSVIKCSAVVQKAYAFLCHRASLCLNSSKRQTLVNLTGLQNTLWNVWV